MLHVHGHIESVLEVCLITSFWFRFVFLCVWQFLTHRGNPEVGFESKH